MNLENVKPGDEVTVFSRGSVSYITKVVRLTATRLVVKQYDEAFRRDNGRLIRKGDRFSFCHAEPTTERHREDLAKYTYTAKLLHSFDGERAVLSKMPAADLKALWNAIQEKLAPYRDKPLV